MNNKAWYWVLGIIILLVIVYAIYAHQHNSQTQSAQQTQQSQNSSAATSSAQNQQQAATLPHLSYGDAINTYKFRFQFSQCHASPGIISVPKNAPVMLDNRDSVAHTIKANGQSFRIPALDYAVIYPQQTTGAGVNLADSNVTCDGGGAGTLNVEK